MIADTAPGLAAGDGVAGRSASRGEAVFAQLHREIMLGLLPPESPLRELDLAERFSCSQGTIRETLMRLSEEGLVIRRPRRGTLVAPCRSADASVLIRLRLTVECDHLDRLLERADTALENTLHGLLNAMRNAARDADEYGLAAHDRAFHVALFDAADLPLVTPILRRCLIHVHRFKIMKSGPGRALEETAERHLPILEALRARDRARFHEVLQHHISTIVDLGPDLTEDIGP